jgi:hypothetical protein
MKLLGIVVAIVLALAAAAWKVYDLGVTAGKATCQADQAKDDRGEVARQNADVQGDIKRGTRTGAAHERTRVALDKTFDHLEKEQAHAPVDPVDACVLPDDRLRIWRAANAGLEAGQDGASAQPDGAAATAAATGVGPHARPGSEPPAGEQGLSPAGLADVPAAGVLADQPPGVPSL